MYKLVLKLVQIARTMNNIHVYKNPHKAMKNSFILE